MFGIRCAHEWIAPIRGQVGQFETVPYPIFPFSYRADAMNVAQEFRENGASCTVVIYDPRPQLGMSN